MCSASQGCVQAASQGCVQAASQGCVQAASQGGVQAASQRCVYSAWTNPILHVLCNRGLKALTKRSFFDFGYPSKMALHMSVH